jgi:hypothetical protein
MSSRAYQEHLVVLLSDPEELIEAHTRLRTGNPGRQWGLGAMNRAVAVSAASAWEADRKRLMQLADGLLLAEWGTENLCDNCRAMKHQGHLPECEVGIAVASISSEELEALEWSPATRDETTHEVTHRLGGEDAALAAKGEP